MDNPDLEYFNVTIAFGGKLGSYSIPAYYEDPDALYLPIADLLSLFKIVNTVTDDGQIIKGFVETENRAYEINLPDRFIEFEGKRTAIKEKDALMDLGTLYMNTDLMKGAFGFEFDFNFRNLTAKFNSTFELPVFKLMEQERHREKLGAGKQGDLLFDTVLPRDYHWWRGGMIDWSVASSQSNKYPGETRMELGGGVELLGGETNVFLNWSSRYGMSREQQQYTWRWADNNLRALRQVMLGRVSTRSIASVLAPMDGFVLTNTPTTVRKALGTYQIADHTEPDWVVELYVNNTLMDYTRADASGFYRFDVPIVYGSTDITLRFYGPGGEVRSEEKRFNMPYNMLPVGELEYKAVGGSVMDTVNSRYGRIEMNYGVARWLTAGAGVEYLSSIANNPEIPFVNVTFQPLAGFLFMGEYAHKVRTRATLNVSLPAHANLDVMVAIYDPNQEAIIYNYLQERSVGLSLPFRVNRFSGYSKALLRQNLYESFNYNSAEWMVSANCGRMNTNITHFVNWTSTGLPNLYANVAAAWRIGRTTSIRPSAQYNYTTRNWISLRGEMETRIFSNGYASLRFENNFLSNTSNINLSLRYELPFMMTSLSGGGGNRQFQAAQSARGSFALGSGNRYVHADKRGAVGRSGIAIQPFVDVNFNGIRDEGEPATDPLRVRCSGGQVILTDKDSIVRIVGLEPFTEYTLTLDESTFDNLAWRLPFKTVKLTTDPNQFKTIAVAVHPMGEVTGFVTDELGNGIGRILVTFTDETGKQVARTLSESDGFYTYMGFRPGTYTVSVDSTQLRVLKMRVEPVDFVVREHVQGDLVDVDPITLFSLPKPVVEVAVDTSAIRTDQDTLLNYFVVFDNDQTTIKAGYTGSLNQLATFLTSHPDVKLEVQGHTDTVGASVYNQRLSLKRACAVAQYLMANGVNADQLSVVGFGESHPINANVTELERAANRRVTFDKMLPGAPTLGATAGSLSEALMAAATMHVRQPGEGSSKTAVDVPAVPALEAAALSSRERVVARKKTRDMMFLDLGDGRYIIQFGAFASSANAQRLCQRLNSLLEGGVEVIHENELYKVQTVVIQSVEETIGLAKKVRLSTILEE